jgi:hypothetical protein
MVLSEEKARHKFRHRSDAVATALVSTESLHVRSLFPDVPQFMTDSDLDIASPLLLWRQCGASLRMDGLASWVLTTVLGGVCRAAGDGPWSV